MNTSPTRIKEFRQRAFLTQAELAKLMDLSVTMINKHEAGSRSLTREQIIRYAEIFKVETHELFQDAEPLNVPTTIGDTVRPAVPRSIRRRIAELDSIALAH
jgi:DNA-binding XRE family transcriptional regulator